MPVVLLSLALGAVSAALISCGSSGSDDIPPNVSAQMLHQLTRASEADAQGECDTVASAATEVQRLAASVQPGDVKQAVLDGAGNLDQLASTDCDTTTEDTTTEEEPTTTTPPTTTTSTTKPKPTTTTKSTTTTSTTTATPPKPPSGGGGGGGGGGTGTGGIGGGGTGPGKGN
jgi:hypothetical protein